MSSGNSDNNGKPDIDPFRKVRTKKDAAESQPAKKPQAKTPKPETPKDQAGTDPFRKVRTKADVAARPAAPPRDDSKPATKKIDPFKKVVTKSDNKKPVSPQKVNPFHKVRAKGQPREEKLEPFRKVTEKTAATAKTAAPETVDPFHKVSEATSHLKGQKQDKPAPASPNRVKLAAIMVTTCLILVAGIFGYRHLLTPPPDNSVSEESLSNDLVADNNVIIPLPSQPEVIELSGDPIFIERQKTSSDRLEKLPVTSEKTAKSLTTNADIWYFNDELLAANVNLMSALPIKQENLAFFRQSSAPSPDQDAPEKQPDTAPDQQKSTPVGDKNTAPVKDTIMAIAPKPDSNDENDENLTQPTTPRRGSGIAFISGENAVGRNSRIQVLNKFLTESTISEFLVSRGFEEEDSKTVEAMAKEKFKVEKLAVDDIIAVRGYRLHPEDKKFAPVQVSIYQKGSFTGTLARADNEQYTLGEDPWFSKPLFEASTTRKPASKKYRLLDAIFSAATRNNIPRSVVGEAILLLSKSFDLKTLAKPGESIKMIYADEPRDGKTGLGRLLYVGINRKAKKLECFVFRIKPKDPYECATAKGASKSVSGMYTPVNGALTSRFGPRMHPILKKMKMHSGVDWAAPTGTPVHAAFSGRVTFVGVKGGYGNFIRLSHGKGRGTGYAHLSRFAKITKKGAKVSAGQIIGYVGTTGRSTGPHLHFELYRGGRATDPFGSFQRHIAKGGAVATMVNQIVRIESAGNPNAKNPLSTATGLGQFIESTWMRMIRQHRPDVLKGRSRAQVLALRTDPALALEMTTKLTQGSASYLRARGQPVTPGNLYLAHFLGPEGAMKALRAPADKQLLEIFGSGVINANPFLRGKTADWVVNWAARKMNRRGRKRGKFRFARSRPANKYASSKAFQAYKTAIGVILSNS